MKKQNILICFCKHPEPGLVKSRLAKKIGPTQACIIYKKVFEQTLITLKETNICSHLYCFPNIHHDVLQQYSNKYDMPLARQADGNLGAKMFLAIRDHINIETSVVLIGTDCPEINANYLLQAFECLNSGYDIVLGPALDGGYALIGANKIDESIFNNVEWSTSGVLKQTIENISKLGWKHKCLTTVRDIDTIEDYEYFSSHEKYKNMF